MELDWLLAPPLPEAMPRQRVRYLRLRDAILSGRLAPGTPLPASRSLAASLKIARNTVLFAYEQLAAEGCLLADRQGTRLAPQPPCSPNRRARQRRCRSPPARRTTAPFPFAVGAPAWNAPGAMPVGASLATPPTAATRPCARPSPAISPLSAAWR